jgi:hypothetical protein
MTTPNILEERDDGRALQPTLALARGSQSGDDRDLWPQAAFGDKLR